jgi:hypothetical protein
LKHVTLIPTAIRDHWHKFEERAGNMPAFSPGRIVLASLCASVMTATPAMAGEALDGARLPWPLALPFAGILLSIALGPLATAAASFVHSMALEYTTILALGTVIASIIGTTAASMILIRPLIRANSARAFNAHVVVFFIFLVSNIGGVLTPLGDPPLFLGFLQGIDFFWTTRLVATGPVRVRCLAYDFLCCRFVFLPA